MLFYILIVCTVTLPPDVNPIAVDKYIYIMEDWKSLVGNKSYRNTVGPQRLGEIREVKCLPSFVKGMDLSSASPCFSSLREGCKPEQLQEIEVDIIWTIYLWRVDSETL